MSAPRVPASLKDSATGGVISCTSTRSSRASRCAPGDLLEHHLGGRYRMAKPIPIEPTAEPPRA